MAALCSKAPGFVQGDYTMRTDFLIVSMFALAACGGPETKENAATDRAETEETTEAEETAKDEVGAASSEVASTETTEVEEQGAEPLPADQKTSFNTIPVAYHGVWDATTGWCAAESDARLEISETKLGFYESVGTVIEVGKQGDGIKVTVAMEGEGEKWEDSYIFVLEDDKLNTLQVETNSDFERKRCK